MTQQWYSEDRVKDAIALYLEQVEGWQSIRVARGKQPGVDISAEREGRKLALEVKGYPSKTHVAGAKQGQRNRANLGAQARNWFLEVLGTALIRKSEEPARSVGIGFPVHQTYMQLAKKITWARRKLELLLYFVDECGEVRIIDPSDEIETKP